MIVQDNDPRVEASFSLKNRIARVAWGMVWLLLCRYSPRPAHRWRALILRLFGAKLGQDVHVYPKVTVWAPWQLSIGNRVGIADGAVIYNMAACDIADNAVISQEAYLCGGTHDIDSDNFQLIARPIRIGRDAWVCARAFIGPGVTVPEGCVIGAQAVVMKSPKEPWSVWSGNPAVRIRERKQGVRKA